MLFILIVLQGKALIAHLWTYIVTWDYPLRANFFGDKNGTLSNPWYYILHIIKDKAKYSNVTLFLRN